MKRIGKTFSGLLVLILSFGYGSSQAAVTASVDRSQVAMGDSLRLTITATEGEEISNADLRPLQARFQILQRSTSSNMRIENGKRSHTKQLQLDISPLQEGQLTIPPMRVGSAATNSLQISVTAVPDVNTGNQAVVFQAEVDREQVYVQGQVLLTLRVMQSIQLEGGNISEIELDNAFVKTLEQNSFQRTIDGRPWLVHELRYAIFPEQSGTLAIPAQTFSARVREGRRDFFGMGGSGRMLRRNSDAISIDVLPRPDTFPSSTWLPARRLTLEERWSTPPEQLQAGESATRTIHIMGEGLLGAQLPPLTPTPADGLKYYPDQPQIGDREVASGILGTRQDSAAVVPTRAGNWSIPEIRIPWWDTETEQVRYAVLPAREIAVAAANPASGTAALSTPDLDSAAASNTATTTAGSHRAWQLVSVISTTGWLLSLLYLWRKRERRVPAPAASAASASEKRTFKELQRACSGTDAIAARAAIIAWANTLPGSTAAVSLAQVAAQLSDEQWRRELEKLDASIYGASTGNWSGQAITECARRLRAGLLTSGRHSKQQLGLYPQAS